MLDLRDDIDNKYILKCVRVEIKVLEKQLEVTDRLLRCAIRDVVRRLYPYLSFFDSIRLRDEIYKELANE